MDKIKKIRQKIRRGDLKTIASLSRYSYVYVRKVLTGERFNKDIIRIALEFVAEREKMEQNIRNRNR